MNMSLEPLPLDVYTDFCRKLFEKNGKTLEKQTVEKVYNDFEGYTWYIHIIMNELYALTNIGEVCGTDMIETAIENVVLSQQQAYKDLLAQIPQKQKMVLEAIALEGRAYNVTSTTFIKKYSLPSASSVQAALKGLLEKDIVTQTDRVYKVYDFFLARYLSSK